MRKYFMTALVLTGVFVFATSGLALEASLHSISEDPDRDLGWSANVTCSILYANYCNGYVYAFDESGFRFNDANWGQHYQKTDCCGPGESSVITSTTTYTWTGAPFGYGFTGTVSIYAATAGTKCPTGSPLASQPWANASGQATWLWGIDCTKSFVQLVNTGPNGAFYSFASDAPSVGQGPGNMDPCQSPTPTNSFFYGVGGINCPGSELTASIVPNSTTVSLFFWSAQKVCKPVSVQESTFGQIKGLYR